MPDDQIPHWLSWIGVVGTPGLIAAFVLAVFTGLLIPRRTVTFLAEERDSRLKALEAERDAWREAAETWQRSVQALVGQVEHLTEQSEVTAVLLQSIKNQAG